MEPSAHGTSSRLGGVGRGWVIASALAALALIAALTAAGPRSSPRPPRPPRLTAALPESPRCSVARGAALARAQLLEQQAAAQRARYPFAPEVGVGVWRSWTEAADCQRLADDEGAARRSGALAASWQGRLEHDLRASHLRLERALATSEPAAAARHARQLLALLPAKSDSYRRWLLRVRQGGLEAGP